MAKDSAVTADSNSEQEQFYEQDIHFPSKLSLVQMPGTISLAAATAGYVPPQHNNDFTYVDLGCGPGTTLVALAAMYPNATFFGVDFNETHIQAGQDYAEKLGLQNLTFIQKSFADIEDGDLPEDCDFVTCQGCYAWLEEDLAKTTRDLIAKILKPGGLAMVEYLCLPGKVSVDPLWKLIQDLVPSADYENSYERAKAGYNLLDTLTRRGMGYLNMHNTVANSVQNYIGVPSEMREAKIKHFSHNAMATGFTPRYFKDMYNEMKDVDLTYAGNARLALNDIELSVPQLQVTTFKEFSGDICKTEMLIDFIRNEQERLAVFVYKAQQDKKAADEYLDSHLRLTRKSKTSELKRWVGNGFNQKVLLKGQEYDLMIKELEYKTLTPKEIADTHDANIEDIRNAAIRLLISGDFLYFDEESLPCPEDLSNITSFEIQQSFNQENLKRAYKATDTCSFASERSPVSLIRLNAIEVMILAEATDKGCGPEDAIKAVRAHLSDTKKKFTTKAGVKMGKHITPDDIKSLYDDFVTDTLPPLIKLGIIKIETK